MKTEDFFFEATQEYINMCAMADPLEDMHYKAVGYFFDTATCKIRFVSHEHPLRDTDIFLPMQHQLQHFLKFPGKVLISPASDRKFLMITTLDKTLRRYTSDSHEGVWLMCFMEELHRKIWNGTEWVIK